MDAAPPGEDRFDRLTMVDEVSTANEGAVKGTSAELSRQLPDHPRPANNFGPYGGTRRAGGTPVNPRVASRRKVCWAVM